ncbi:hypothetical protein KY362_01235 [Candidatus Woesearchaeota archaeon]|nr:hypothetical protein [Candidatus Woesearchaeota archaeon]
MKEPFPGARKLSEMYRELYNDFRFFMSNYLPLEEEQRGKIASLELELEKFHREFKKGDLVVVSQHAQALEPEGFYIAEVLDDEDLYVSIHTQFGAWTNENHIKPWFVVCRLTETEADPDGRPVISRDLSGTAYGFAGKVYSSSSKLYRVYNQWPYKKGSCTVHRSALTSLEAVMSEQAGERGPYR